MFAAMVSGRRCAIGDVAHANDARHSLHAHTFVGLSDGSTRGSHLLDGIVRPTLEVTLVEEPAHLRPTKRPELGIALIDCPRVLKIIDERKLQMIR
jgi:uncharacterized protein